LALSEYKGPSTFTETPTPVNVEEANRQIAQQNIVLIYSLIEQNQVELAHRRFEMLKEPLKQYLLPEAYTVLEATVMQSYSAERQSR